MKNYVRCSLFAVMYFIYLFWSFEGKAAEVVKVNHFGVMEAVGNGFIYYPQPHNRNLFLEIYLSSHEVRYMFPDASYVSMDARNGQIKRFSANTGHTEQFIVDTGGVPDWQTTTANLSLYQSYVNFENAPHDDSAGSCYVDGVLVIPCPFPQSTLFTDYSNEVSTLSACSYEESYLTNHGYNGFPTMNRCTRTARLFTLTGAFGALVFCGIEISKGGCAVALPTWFAAMHNENDVRLQCAVSYNQAIHNLQQCVDNQTGGGGGPNPDPGTGQPSAGGICLNPVVHRVCTPGGCLSWIEIEFTNC